MHNKQHRINKLVFFVLVRFYYSSYRKQLLMMLVWINLFILQHSTTAVGPAGLSTIPDDMTHPSHTNQPKQFLSHQPILLYFYVSFHTGRVNTLRLQTLQEIENECTTTNCGNLIVVLSTLTRKWCSNLCQFLDGQTHAKCFLTCNRIHIH